MNKPERCVHGHTAESHPNCFTRFWYKKPGERLGYLDIESNGLDADSGWMVSWCIKPDDKKDVIFDHITYNDIYVKKGVVRRGFDKRIVQSLVDEMQNYTGFVTYYGTGFDIPYIRSKALKYGIRFPEYKKMSHIDLYYLVRGKMKLSRNSLAMSTKLLHINGKTPLAFEYWGLACLGDEEAISKLLVHNMQDVIILQKLHRELEPFGKFDKKSL